MGAGIEFFIAAFISIIAIINPLSTVGVLLSLTKGSSVEERNQVAFRSSLLAVGVLIFFALTGFLVFQLYSITIDAFRIAGGIVLFLIGIRMLFPAAGSGTHTPTGDQVYIVPLAIPMTSGPGAITTAVVLASQAADAVQEIALWAAILAACAVNYIVLRFAAKINSTLGKEGVSALIKIMGLLVCSVGVQFIINGMKAAFPLLA